MGAPVKLSSVMMFANGQTAVFDCHGEQVPHLQGRILRVREQLLPLIDEETEITTQGPGGPLPLTRTQFVVLCYDREFERMLRDMYAMWDEVG